MNTFIVHCFRGTLFFMSFSIALAAQNSAPKIPKPKVVFSEWQCKNRTEKQLLAMIAGYVRVDSAYKRVEPCFNEGLGDYFTLRCINCLADSGPGIMEFPKHKEFKTTLNSQNLGTTQINRKPQDAAKMLLAMVGSTNKHTDQIEQKIINNMSDQAQRYQWVEMMGCKMQNESFIENQGRSWTTQMSDDCRAALQSSPYLMVFNLDSYKILKDSNELSYSLHLIDTRSNKTLSGKQFMTTIPAQTNLVGHELASTELADKTTKEIILYLNKQIQIIQLSDFRQVNLDITRMNKAQAQSLQESLEASQCVLDVVPLLENKASILQLRVACSNNYLTEMINQKLLPTLVAESADDQQSIRIIKK